MPYDQSWMGFGVIGGLEVAAIATVVGFLLFTLLQRLGRTQGWSQGLALSWAYMVSVLLVGGRDLWDLFYFSYGRVQSLQLLQAKLAEVHDPDNIGLRVLFAFIGAFIGVGASYLLFARRRSP